MKFESINSQHPRYVEFLPSWQVLGCAVEGTGGFKDGTYLVAHPREWLDYNAETPRTPSPKLKTRRKLATYANAPELIVAQYQQCAVQSDTAALRGAPKRRAASVYEVPRERRWPWNVTR